jgi:diacylglycerol kinase family enzyme
MEPLLHSRAVLLINCKAGCALRPGYLDEFAAEAARIPGVHVHRWSSDEDIAALVEKWKNEGVESIGVAGGDGTISSVANLLAGGDIALVPIPFGTLNHFCKDVGAPLDPVVALRALSPEAADEKTIDLGQVNGRYFVNNSSLGLYPQLVRRREKRQHMLGKWLAYVVAAFEFLKHPVRMRVQLRQEEGGKPFHAGLIFVSNNPITEGFWGVGQRESLDRGELQLLVLKHGTVWATFRAAAAFLRGKTGESDVLNEHRLQKFQVTVKHRKQVRVSCDGETLLMRPPIQYSIAPAALRVRVAKAEVAATAA